MARDTALMPGQGMPYERPELTVVRPGGAFEMPNVLAPELDPARRQEIRDLAVFHDQAWESDPRFDRLVDVLASAAQSSPELDQLMR
ncbi:MAG TPA: hypothetical protein VM389_07515, partial [Phycisphaerae bacterium]|nr:hypothetical protein [Phycisphaerae bacterium]